MAVSPVPASGILFDMLRSRSSEPFSASRVVIVMMLTLVIPSLFIATLGMLALMWTDARLTPYVVVMAFLVVSIAIGTTLVARDALRGARLARLKTDFVSHVSHELRTPLTSIRMFIETLQLGRARTDDERQACLDLMAKETARLSEMIERVLEWSRIESGRKVLHKEPLSMADTAAEASEIFESLVMDRKIKIELVRERSLPPVSMDRGAVIDILLNLLSNAYKYAGPRKEIRMIVGATGRWATVAVEDNGPGVRRRDRKRIFDRFYRANDLLSRGTEGTGLGLAIARRLAEGLGGRLTYTPREPTGSRFTLKLPLPRPKRAALLRAPAMPSVEP